MLPIEVRSVAMSWQQCGFGAEICQEIWLPKQRLMICVCLDTLGERVEQKYFVIRKRTHRERFREHMTNFDISAFTSALY